MTGLRIATVAAEDDGARWARAIALRAGVAVAVALDGRDGRGLAERATLLRSADPAAILLVGRSGAARAIAEVVDAARVAATDAEAPPFVLVAAHPDVARRAESAAAGVLPVARAPHPSSDEGDAAVAQLRARRGDAQALDALEARVRALDDEDVLACEIDESGARLAVGSHDRVLGVELRGVGVGAAADALARLVGGRALRRWLPSEPIPDPAALRDRLANLSRAGSAGASADALRLSLLREALSATLAAARRDIESEALERPRRIVLGGAFLALRPGEAVGVLLDAMRPSGGARVQLGDRDIALVYSEAPRRGGLSLLIADDRGEREERVPAGALGVLQLAGAALVRSGRREVVAGTGGDLGLVVDARPRPLSLPERDAERIALLGTWMRALDVEP